MRSFGLLAAVLALGVSCAAPPPGPLALERQVTPAGTRLLLRAEPGAKINARLKPALELASGMVLRFDAAALSPDSAYFAEPPSAELPAGTPLRGTLRASVCRADERVCRIVEVPVL